ncbi:MAG: ribose 5-phosphate isomerase B [Clostridia bacterium]|nr:ribose 5-phosphate isomerase B [Clostridia bacterium]
MIALGCDHGGWELKEAVKKYLDEKGIQYEDFGCFNTESVDYPVYGKKVAEAIVEKKAEKGLLFCGTGLGMMLCANKYPGVRAICASDIFSVEFSRMHNNANVLTLGGRVMGPGLAIKLVDTFIHTEFEGGRHAKRVEMYDKII